MYLKLGNPCSIVISAVSGTKKNNLVSRLIDHVQKMFSNSIKRIVFFCEFWQTSCEAYLQKVEFLQDLPTEQFLKQSKDLGRLKIREENILRLRVNSDADETLA